MPTMDDELLSETLLFLQRSCAATNTIDLDPDQMEVVLAEIARIRDKNLELNERIEILEEMLLLLTKWMVPYDLDKNRKLYLTFGDRSVIKFDSFLKAKKVLEETRE